MSAPARYSMLKQTLDDRDVAKGLGRPAKVRRKCCRPWMWWTCFAVTILMGVGLTVAVSLVLAMPQTSRPFYKWFHSFSGNETTEPTPNTPASSNATFSSEQATTTAKYQMPVLGHKNGTTTNDSIEYDEQPVYNETTTAYPSGSNSTLSFEGLKEEAKEYFSKAYKWAEEQWVRIPKIPFYIGLSVFALIIVSVLWLVIYRRVVKRQRRRRLGKLVAELQAEDKSHLLNSSDDSDDE